MNRTKIQKHENKVLAWHIAGSILATPATQQIPGFDGNGNVSAELAMINLDILLAGSLAIGFTIKFVRG